PAGSHNIPSDCDSTGAGEHDSFEVDRLEVGKHVDETVHGDGVRLDLIDKNTLSPSRDESSRRGPVSQSWLVWRMNWKNLILIVTGGERCL
ncbi:hypothetical protein A2U01_0078291, partial [Trifolium medium]|nr:hypothetical protein [Trifolium medium]